MLRCATVVASLWGLFRSWRSKTTTTALLSERWAQQSRRPTLPASFFCRIYMSSYDAIVSFLERCEIDTLANG